LRVEELDLPPEGHCPKLIETVNSFAAPLLADAERFMIAENGEELMEESGIKPYEDPRLNNPGVKLALASRLWRSGMLTTTDQKRGVVSLFAVVKKVVLGPTGWTVRSRLIFDHRRGNLQWRKPPWTALSGPEALAAADLSHPGLREMEFSIGTGDIPNWYYVLAISSHMASFFVIPGVSPSELRDKLIADGWPGALPDPTAGFLALCVLVMGWRWAVWLAETTLECIVQQAMSTERHLVPGARIPRFGPSPEYRFAYWTYVDDFGVMGFSYPGELVTAVTLKNRIRKCLVDAGFQVHKEEEGTVATVVGIRVGAAFRAEPRGIFACPPVARFWLLY